MVRLTCIRVTVIYWVFGASVAVTEAAVRVRYLTSVDPRSSVLAGR